MSFGKMLLRFKGRVFSGIRLDVKRRQNQRETDTSGQSRTAANRRVSKFRWALWALPLTLRVAI